MSAFASWRRLSSFEAGGGGNAGAESRAGGSIKTGIPGRVIDADPDTGPLAPDDAYVGEPTEGPWPGLGSSSPGSIGGDTTVDSAPDSARPHDGSTVVCGSALVGAVSCAGIGAGTGGGNVLPGRRGGIADPAGRFGSWIPVGGALRVVPRRGGSGGNRRPHA